MRRALKFAVPLALVIAVAIVAVSLADDNSNSGREATGYVPAAGTTGSTAPQTGGVIGEIKQAAAKEAPEVAGPIIDRSEKAGNITAAQADALRAAAQGLADGKSPRELAPTVDLRDWDVRVVIRDAFEALSRRAPAIADPILDDAVREGKITESQAAEIRDHVAKGGHRRGCRKRERETSAPIGDQI